MRTVRQHLRQRDHAGDRTVQTVLHMTMHRFFDALMEMGTVTSRRTALAIPGLILDSSLCTDSSKSLQ